MTIVRSILSFLFSAPSSLRMSQDYAAIAGSALGALMVVGAVEVANTLKSLGSESQKLRILFADDLKDSAIAHRTGTTLPSPRRIEVQSRVRLYKLLRIRVRRTLRFLYTIWGINFTISAGSLLMVLSWSAAKHGGPGNLVAFISFYGCQVAIILTLWAFLYRVTALRTLAEWEDRVEIARRMGLPQAQVRSLMNSWARDNGTSW